jgi:hypothetical protein
VPLSDAALQVIEAIAGGLIRTFTRLNRLEMAYADLRQRLAAFEGDGGIRPVTREARPKHPGGYEATKASAK